MFSDTEYMEATCSLIHNERQRICKELDNISTIKYYAPSANFVLVKLLRDDITSTDIFDAAIRKGLMIRDCSTFPFLDNRFFRFCFMAPEKNDELLEVIKEHV